MLLMGIDGGGTSCRALLCDEKLTPLGRGRSGAANIVTDFEGARAHIIEAATQALGEAGLSKDALSEVRAFLGLAGANLRDFGARMAAALPFARARVDTDGLVALQGALGDEEGLAAIIGTGSVFISRLEGQVRSAGGWGFMVGDTASGARIGRTLLQETLLAYDGIRPATALTDHVMARFDGDPESLVEYAQTAIPGAFGVFAPLIFEYYGKGDPVARRIIKAALGDISEILSAIMKDRPQPVCLQGGLGRIYAGLLPPPWRGRVRPPLGDATEGAAYLALRHFLEKGAAGA